MLTGMAEAGDAFNAALAAVLRAERLRRGLLIRELAERAGMHVNTLQRYESGHRDIPIPALYDICAGLGVEPRRMVERAEARFLADQVRPDEIERDPVDVGRRIRRVLSLVAVGDFATVVYLDLQSTFEETGTQMSRSEWAALIDGLADLAPSETTLRAIASALHVDPRFLLGAAENEFVVQFDAQLELLLGLTAASSSGVGMSLDIAKAREILSALKEKSPETR